MALKSRTSDCKVTFQLLPDSVVCEHSLFIDCGCAVRWFCQNISLQQVHARKYLYMYLWSTLTLWRRLVEYSTCAMSSGLPRFHILLLIVYDHINTICAIIQRLFRQKQTLITRLDGRRCIDDWVYCIDDH